MNREPYGWIQKNTPESIPYPGYVKMVDGSIHRSEPKPGKKEKKQLKKIRRLEHGQANSC